MTFYISMNRATIVANAKNKKIQKPPYEMRTAKNDPNPTRFQDQVFTGTVRFCYDPNAPLVSGAVAWVEIDLDPGMAPVHRTENRVLNLAVSETAPIIDGQ